MFLFFDYQCYHMYVYICYFLICTSISTNYHLRTIFRFFLTSVMWRNRQFPPWYYVFYEIMKWIKRFTKNPDLYFPKIILHLILRNEFATAAYPFLSFRSSPSSIFSIILWFFCCHYVYLHSLYVTFLRGRYNKKRFTTTTNSICLTYQNTV